MSKRYVPVEEQSLALPFFILSSLLAASSVWAVYDETYSRRPWKRYQERFTELQIEGATAELRSAEAERGGAAATAKAAALESERAQLTADLAEMKTSGRYIEQVRQVEKLGAKIYDMKQNWSFSKSEADQYYYEWKHADHANYPEDEVARYGKRYADKLAEAESRQDATDALARKQADIRATYSSKESRLTEIERDLGRLDQSIDAAKRKIDSYQGSYPGIIQYVNDDLEIVDRCGSCHVAADRGGFEDPDAYAKVYRSHPHRSELLGKHPVEKFGCTPCHQGQGTSTQEFFAHAQSGPMGLDPTHFTSAFHKHYWDRALLLKKHGVTVERDENGDAVRSLVIPFLESSCRQCHMADRDLKFAPSLSRARKRVERLGCFGCHNVPGYEDARKVGPSLRGIATKTSPGWLLSWIANPKSFRPLTRMPNFWPAAINAEGQDDPGTAAFRMRQEESQAIAAFLWSVGDEITPDTAGYDSSASAEEGEALVTSVGCLGCHSVSAEDDALIAKQRREGIPEPPAPGEAWSDSVTRVPSDHGPSLTGVGSKLKREWIYAWVKDPKAYWPKTRMPSLRLTDHEASAITNFLMTLKKEGATFSTPSFFGKITPKNVRAFSTLSSLPAKDARRAELAPLKAMIDRGQLLVNNYGCFGCHDVSGFEDAGKIAPDLAEYGVKEKYLLDFGDYITNPEWQSWEVFTYNKLRTPRVYEHPRAQLKMPLFGLNDDQIRDIMVLLKSFTPAAERVHPSYIHKPNTDQAAIEEGRRLVDQYNCRGCHVVENSGGYVRTRYSVNEQNSVIPPYLNGQGQKVRPEWFFNFLNQVTSLRPWLNIRMPSFDMPQEHARTIVHYFSAVDGEPFPFDHQANPAEDPVTFQRAEKVFESLRCVSCHPTSAAKAQEAIARGGGGLAPRLDLAEDRLKQRWITEWLRNPGVMQPGTRMPNFFYGFGSLDPTDWWEDLVDERARFELPAGVASIDIVAGSLNRPSELKGDAPQFLDWGSRFGRSAALKSVAAADWEIVEVLGLAYPMEQQQARVAKPKAAYAPSIAEVRFVGNDGMQQTGVVNLLPKGGSQVLMQQVSAAAVKPEEKIRDIVDYLYLLDSKAKLTPPPKRPEFAAAPAAAPAGADDAAGAAPTQD